MARTRTLAQLRDEVRAITDTEDDPHSPDATLNRWLNQGISKVWNILVRADQLRHMVTTPATINTTSGTTLYALPSDFMEVVLVSLVNGDNRTTIEPYEMQERNSHINSVAVFGAYGTTNVRYRVMGQGINGSLARIELIPDPGNNAYEVHYVQQPQVLSADGDAFDGIAGFEDYAINWAARKVALREENFALASQLIADIREAEASIIDMASERESGRPRQIQNTYSRGHEFWIR